MELNTTTSNIYIISVIKEAWKFRFKSDMDLRIIQEIHIKTNLDTIPEKKNTMNDRVDCSVVNYDDVKPSRMINKEIHAIVFNHYHKQTRIDNYSITIYLK